MSKIAALLRVAHPDNRHVLTVTPLWTASEVAMSIVANNVGAFPVMEDQKLVGIVSERDLVTKVIAVGLDPKRTLVGQIMTADPEYVTPETDMIDCFDLMRTRKIRHLPVVDKRKLVEMLSLRDILHFLWKDKELEAQQFETYIRRG